MTLPRPIRFLVYRLSEQFCDLRYGIISDRMVTTEELGVKDPDCHLYNASCYVRFRQMMKLIQVRPGEDVFLDFGSGMGRVVVLAATYPFRKVIGVELTERLHRVAQENVRRARPRLRCREIELHQMDARAFPILPEVTVIYFWNPFSGKILEDVFGNIRRSVLESPRTITILYLSPPGVTCLDEIKPRLPWLKERQRINFGAGSVSVVYTCSAED